MTVEIISWSISTKVWYRAGIELATPGSVARHATDCATRPGPAFCVLTFVNQLPFIFLDNNIKLNKQIQGIYVPRHFMFVFEYMSYL